MLKYLYDKADTTISFVFACTIGSAQCSGCVVYDPGAIVAA